MKAINIYIDKEQRTQLRKIQQKYCVSLSCLLDQIYLPIMKLAQAATPDILFDKKFYKNYGKYKTSVKAKCTILRAQTRWNISVTTTNILKCFIYNDYHRITKNNDDINKCKNEIENNLTQAYDPYWNYNEQLRNNIKFWKENPQYKKEQDNEK